MANSINPNAKHVADRLEEAVAVLRRLPVGQGKPRGHSCVWPEVAYTAWELMRQEKPPMRLGPPSATQISRMEQTLQWLWWVSEEERKLLWLRAEKVRWKALCWQLGCSRSTAWRKWIIALTKISSRVSH